MLGRPPLIPLSKARYLLLLFLDYQFGLFQINLFTRVTKKPG